MRRFVWVIVVLGASLFCLATGSASAVGEESKRGSPPSPIGGSFFSEGCQRKSSLSGRSARSALHDRRRLAEALVVKVSLNDAEKFIANRGAAGFNALWINLLCNDSTGGFSDGKTLDGVLPFRRYLDLSIPDVSTPNEPYFRRVDAILKAAARQESPSFSTPSRRSAGRRPCYQRPAKDYGYGRYLGRRYAKYPNIVWMHGNDFGGWHDARTDAAR